MMTSNVVAPEEVLVRDEARQRDVVRAAVKVSWSSILAGLVVALGAWVLLSVLGLALGLSQADPNAPASSLRSAGTIAAIWSVFVPLVVLLLGGLVAARTAGVVTRPTGAIHGVVLWALVTIASVSLVGYVVRGVMSAAIGAAAGLTSTATTGAGPGAPGATTDLGRTLGLDSEELIGPVNDRLRSEGKPTVAPRELDATLKDVTATAIREGRVDHAVVLTAVTRNTRLELGDAQDLATRIEMRLNREAAELGRDIQLGAAKVADTTGHVMWWVFLGMVLGLGAAVTGSTLGVSRRQRLAARTMTMTEGYVTHHPAPSAS